MGPIGIQGERGEPGPAGRPGNDGAAGTDGKDGLPGRDGSYVDTAVVNGNGHLLLGLSDGQVIDVGRVVGPVGATGERGATGLPGEPGVDGAAVLSGPRAPQESDGEEGDHWIDISSAEFGFYKKSGEGWTKLANLRQPARDPRVGPVVGGGPGGEGGGGVDGIQEIIGGNGIATNRISASTWSVRAQIDSAKGLTFGGDNQIEIKIGDGLEFDADTGELVSTGGGGKESQPFIDWFQFKVIERSDRFDYDPLFETNANAQTVWEYQLDLQGDGTFVTFEDIPEETRIEIGYYSTPTVSHLRLKKTDAQEGTYPNARARFQVTSELNGTVNVDQTCGLPAWENGECDYGNNPFASLESRVDTGEQVQETLIQAVETIQVQGQLVQLHIENIDADQIQQFEDIEELNTEVNEIKAEQIEQNTEINDIKAEQIDQNNELISLQNQIDDLAIEKGRPARYTVVNVDGTPVTRSGEIGVASSNPTEITAISLGLTDLDDQLTKEVHVGDIIELVDSVTSATVTFICTDAQTAPTLIGVEYQEGANTIEVGDEELVYIYPQNEEGVTKEYVDEQDELRLALTGGTMSGVLHVLLEPNWEDEATSKSYVDNVAATTLASVLAQNYATETYVDNAISDINLDQFATEDYVDQAIADIDLDFLPLSGGTVDGLTTITNTRAGADNSYVFNVLGPRLPEGQTSAFRVTASGSVKAGHSTVSPFLAEANNDVITKGFLANALGEGEFLGNYYTKAEVDQLDSLHLKRYGNNDVATGAQDEGNTFRIRGIKEEGNYFTCISINNESMGLYNVRPPEETHHAANREYVDNAVDDAPYLPLSGGTLSDRLFFERRSGVNLIISPNASDTSSSVYACNGGAVRFRSLPGEDVNQSSTHLSYGKLDNGDPGTYIYHLQDPEDELWAANKRYVDTQVQNAIANFSTSERFYKMARGNTAQAKSVTFYESSGFFYYYIDVNPDQGRVIGAPGNFGFKDCALPFKIGWIQSSGAENIMVSAVATLIRKTTGGANHFFQVAVDPGRDDCLIHDPYTVPQGSTCVVTLSGIL